MRSTIPFHLGLFGTVRSFRISRSQHTAASTLLSKFVPWSLSSVVGVPNRAKNSFRRYSMQVSADWSGMAMISVHLVKWSMATMIYQFHFLESGNGPRISTPTRSRGPPTGNWPNGAWGHFVGSLTF